MFGRVYADIHVWHNNPMQRGAVSKIMLDIKTVCRHIQETANFNWLVKGVNQRILADETVRPPLMHGVLEVEFRFS